MRVVKLKIANRRFGTAGSRKGRGVESGLPQVKNYNEIRVIFSKIIDNCDPGQHPGWPIIRSK